MIAYMNLPSRGPLLMSVMCCKHEPVSLEMFERKDLCSFARSCGAVSTFGVKLLFLEVGVSLFLNEDLQENKTS